MPTRRLAQPHIRTAITSPRRSKFLNEPEGQELKDESTDLGRALLITFHFAGRAALPSKSNGLKNLEHFKKTDRLNFFSTPVYLRRPDLILPEGNVRFRTSMVIAGVSLPL
jgi:hypothetical protein